MNQLIQRKSPRLQGFDYSRVGVYFITICTQNRKNTLSTIVGEGSPLPHLLPYGEIVNRWIQEIPRKYSEVSVDCHVIMPNHIHLLLSVLPSGGRANPSPTIDTVIGWLKYQITKEIKQTDNKKTEKPFQRSFHDHIIRNRQDYEKIYRYIHENPIRWQFDKFYSE